jgi:hypothetical protein
MIADMRKIQDIKKLFYIKGKLDNNIAAGLS